MPLGGAIPEAETVRKQKILIKSAWGSADPTQASFPFHHAKAFAEAGHPVQIFLLGEAVSLMRTAVANSIVPVGWPPLAEALAKVLERKIFPILRKAGFTHFKSRTAWRDRDSTIDVVDFRSMGSYLEHSAVVAFHWTFTAAEAGTRITRHVTLSEPSSG